jgi:hypothetical protein
MIKQSVTLQEVVDLLNGLVKLDALAMSELCKTRVECNDALANHPTVQVTRIAPAGGFVRTIGPEVYSVGLVGILNGIFGTYEDGWGALGFQYHTTHSPTAENFFFFIREDSEKIVNGVSK